MCRVRYNDKTSIWFERLEIGLGGATNNTPIHIWGVDRVVQGVWKSSGTPGGSKAERTWRCAWRLAITDQTIRVQKVVI